MKVRLVKMFGLAALAAVAAMAFIGVGSASATFPTQLCNVHTGLECPAEQGTSEVHMTLTPGTVGKLLTNLVNVLCLENLATATPLALGNPQVVHVLSFTFGGCGTDANHNNCVVTTTEKPLLDLLKTGLDAGTLKALSGKIHIRCENVTIFKVTIDCTYNISGLELGIGANMITANETTVNKEAGGALCPSTSKWDFLIQPLVNTYVLQ